MSNIEQLNAAKELFKVGDKVRIVNPRNEQLYDLGIVISIHQSYPDYYHIQCKKFGCVAVEKDYIRKNKDKGENNG